MEATVVGREREVAELTRGLALGRRGPAAILIEGAPGIGKTHLWRTAVAAARGGTGVVLQARPAEAEARLSYAVLGDLVEPWRAAALAGLPAPQRRALAAALLLSDPSDGAPDPRAIAVAVLGALRALAAARGGLVIAIDDLQWLDADSARVLGFAVRRLTDERVVLLLARRGPSEAGLPLGAEALPGDRLVHLRLAPFEPRTLHTLLRARLGVELARPLLLRLHAATNGNPLHALEVGRLIADAGVEQDAFTTLPVPETLRTALETRLQAVSAAADDALLVAASLARPTVTLVRAAQDDAETGLREAVAAGLLERDGDDLRFAHPLYASVAYTRAPEPRRRAVHRRLAALLTDPEEHARQLALGAETPDAAVARALAVAGRRAAARGASEAALDLARHALRVAPPELSERGWMSVEAADFAFVAGDTAAARRLLEQTLEGADHVPRAVVLARLATLATYDGSMQEARRLGERALGEATDDPATLVMIRRRLALAHLMLGELDAAERHTRAAIGLAGDAGDEGGLARALANLACVLAVRGQREDARPLLERALAMEDAPGQASIDDSPTAIAGLLLMYAGDLAGARRRLQAGLDRAQSQGGDPLSTGLLFALSELESRSGRFPAALELARRGLEASEQTGQRTERSVMLYVQALAAARLGHVEVARVAAREGVEIAQRAEQRWAEAQNRWALGQVELSLGRSGAAWEAMAPGVLFLRANGVGELGLVPIHPDAIEAAAGAGALHEAETALDDLDRLATAPWLRAAAMRSAALVSAARGDTAGALEAADGAVEAYRALDLPFDLARALLTLGTVLRRSKRRARARSALEESAVLFGTLGAGRWQEQARDETGRLGGRRPGDRDTLTTTERRIAERAARGESNREIAAALFVAERTVEANLTRAYRKLGVRSRTQLTSRLPT